MYVTKFIIPLKSPYPVKLFPIACQIFILSLVIYPIIRPFKIHFFLCCFNAK